jgi:hypothetical protein
LAAIVYIVAVGAVLTYISSPRALERHHVAGALAVASLICFAFGLVGIYTGTVSAPRPRGRIPDTVPVLKDEHPLLFWMNVGLYLGIGLALLYWAFTFLS